MTTIRVGYVALRVADLDTSVAYAERMLGLRLSSRQGETAYLTCNRRHHELVLIQGSHSACDHIAFDLLSRASFDAAVQRIEQAQLQPIEGASEVGVERAIRFVAPGGLVIELFHGMAHDQPARYEAVAPRPLKFEHITLKSSQKPQLEQVLIDVVGLRLSDRADDAASWLRASDEYHGVSVIAADVDALHHYAWQYPSFASLAEVGDHLMLHDRRLLWGPGHHGIGDNYFAYAMDSDGVIVEYSAGIQRIDDEEGYVPRTWPDVPLTVNQWGNPPPPQAFLDAATPWAVGSGVM